MPDNPRTLAVMRVLNEVVSGLAGGQSQGPTPSARLGLVWLLVLLPLAPPPLAGAESSSPLYERVQEVLERIEESPLDEPIVVQSTDDDSRIEGEVAARIDQPFAAVAELVGSVEAWCQLAFLHINIKACTHNETSLRLYAGRKHFETPEEASALDLEFQVKDQSDDLLAVVLRGDEGPHGTHDFMMGLVAVPLDEETTLLEMQYSLGIGTAARMAMELYLSTMGRHRIGFTRDDEGEFIGGLQGVIERNVMRFYLALQALLDTRDKPQEERLEARLKRWLELTDRYAEQLRELDRETYLSQKTREWKEQQDL